MPKHLVEWAGVCGFFLAALSLLIHWLEYRHQKEFRKEQAEERVKVHLRWQTVGDGVFTPLIAPVVNTGRVDVHLDKVVLERDLQNSGVRKGALCIPLTCEVPVLPVLTSGEKREYFIQPNHPQLSRLATGNTDGLRLVVYSNHGEIARVSGKLLAPYLPSPVG